MAEDRTEEEQVEILKKWFEDNGTSMIVTIIVVLAAVFGFRTWESQTIETAEAASAIYEELNEALAVGPLDSLTEAQESTGKFLAQQLKTEYSSSVYSNFAAFHLAKIAADKEDLETAKTELQWALDNSADDRIAIVANYRLARVKYGMEDYDGALTQLDAKKPGAHISSYEELRGDALKALGKNDAAREAYQRSVNEQGDAKRPLSQMKLDDMVAPKTILAADATTSGDAVATESDSGDS